MTEADGNLHATSLRALSQAPRPAPRPWNTRRRVEHRRAHQGRFHSPRDAFSNSRCEPNLAKPLSPVRASCPAAASAPSALARCEPNLAKPLSPVRASCPTAASAASVRARCEPNLAKSLLSGMPCRPDSLPTVRGQGNGVSVPLSDEPEASEDHLRFDASLQCLIERMSS